jgi:hypothetical protein
MNRLVLISPDLSVGWRYKLSALEFPMFKLIPAAMFALALSGAAVAQHPACTDQASAQTYLDRFATDMTAASEAGKLDEDAMKDIQQTLNTLTADLSAADFGAFCEGLDELRAAYKF